MPKHWAHLTYAMTFRWCWDLPRFSISFSHPFPTPAKHLAQCQPRNLAWGRWQRESSAFSSHLHPTTPARTCEDGLVDPQGGGPDFDDSDVRRHLVANYKGKSRAAPSSGTGSARRPGEGGRQTLNTPAQPSSAPRLGATGLHLGSCCLPSFATSTVQSPGQGLAFAENHYVPTQCGCTAAPSLQQRGVQPMVNQGPAPGCLLSACKA